MTNSVMVVGHVSKAIVMGIVVALLSLLVAFCIFVFFFYHSLADPSSKAAVYDGPILPDARQAPIDSGFDHATEAMAVVRGVDLRGKNIVITGGHSGTGLEAVKALASAGAEITALARDTRRAKALLAGIPNVTVEYVDLLEPASIDEFAHKFIASGKPLHILINSAAIMGTPLERDKRGFERQFATNVLGHFELTVKLHPALSRAGGARIINLSSRGHRAGEVNFDDIHFERTEYSGLRAYAQSKTALALLSVKEDAMLRGEGIRAFAVHPGPVPSTDLFAAGRVGFDPASEVWFARLSAKIVRFFHVTELLNYFRRPNNPGDLYKTAQQGGATTVWAAVSHDLDGRGGLYLEDCNIAPLVPNGSPAPFGVRPWAVDAGSAERLWKECEEMTGIRFGVDYSFVN
jgi:Dehydrogenases with different specificities (related to short-chain alcohol dehydrogenases)